MSKKQNTKTSVQEKDQKYKLFYGIAVFIILYMGFSAVTTYFDFVETCKSYNYSFSDEWFMFVKTLLAAVIPCIVYASTMYGIGYILENKE